MSSRHTQSFPYDQNTDCLLKLARFQRPRPACFSHPEIHNLNVTFYSLLQILPEPTQNATREKWSVCEFDVQVTVHRDKILTIKTNRCTSFSNFIFGIKLCMFSDISSVHHQDRLSLYTQQWCMSY